MTGPPVINFAAGSDWAAVAQVEMRRWATDDRVTPLAVRVLLAALSRVGRDGHAQFASGELAEMLGKLNIKTGEVSRRDGSTVSDAIKTAKHLGFIEPESCARCLVLSRHVVQKGKGSTKPCSWHERMSL